MKLKLCFPIQKFTDACNFIVLPQLYLLPSLEYLHLFKFARLGAFLPFLCYFF